MARIDFQRPWTLQYLKPDMLTFPDFTGCVVKLYLLQNCERVFPERRGQKSTAEEAWAECVKGSAHTGQCTRVEWGTSEEKNAAEAASRVGLLEGSLEAGNDWVEVEGSRERIGGFISLHSQTPPGSPESVPMASGSTSRVFLSFPCTKQEQKPSPVEEELTVQPCALGQG